MPVKISVTLANSIVDDLDGGRGINRPQLLNEFRDLLWAELQFHLDLAVSLKADPCLDENGVVER